MPLELEIDVPESRQVTLPDSVPVGKVKLTVQPAPNPASPTDDKFERERGAFFRLLPELLKTHRGKVVAIHDEQVIAVGDDRRAVLDEATRIAGHVDLYVETVAEEWPVERFGSRRVVGRRIA